LKKSPQPPFTKGEFIFPNQFSLRYNFLILKNKFISLLISTKPSAKIKFGKQFGENYDIMDHRDLRALYFPSPFSKNSAMSVSLHPLALTLINCFYKECKKLKGFFNSRALLITYICLNESLSKDYFSLSLQSLIKLIRFFNLRSLPKKMIRMRSKLF